MLVPGQLRGQTCLGFVSVRLKNPGGVFQMLQFSDLKFCLCVDGRSECIERGNVFTRVHVDGALVKKLKRCTEVQSIAFSACIYYSAVLSHSPLLDCAGTALLKITP